MGSAAVADPVDIYPIVAASRPLLISMREFMFPVPRQIFVMHTENGQPWLAEIS